MVNNKESIKLLIQELTVGLSKIMDKSYPLCRHDDDVISQPCIKINNAAFELKQKTELLKRELSITD
jgi:hypothetical protein